MPATYGSATKTSEPRDLSARDLALLDDLAQRIQPDDPSLETWFSTYFRQHRRRLAVDLEIVRRGYATPLTIEPNSTFAPDFAAAARSAEAAELGLWAACST